MKNFFKLLIQKRLNFRFPKLSTDSIISKQSRGVLALDITKCTACSACETVCPVSAIKIENNNKLSIDYLSCIWCNLCVLECKENAIFFTKPHKGTIRRAIDAKHTFKLLS